MTTKNNTLWFIIASLVTLYVLSFIPLAYSGGYLPRSSGFFRPRIGGFLAFEDSWVWQPRYGMFYRFHTATDTDTYHADALGYFYSPLIWLQQQFVRPIIRSVQPDGSPVTLSTRKPPRGQLHPEMRRALPQIEADFHLTSEQF